MIHYLGGNNRTESDGEIEWEDSCPGKDVIAWFIIHTKTYTVQRLYYGDNWDQWFVAVFEDWP